MRHILKMLFRCIKVLSFILIPLYKVRINNLHLISIGSDIDSNTKSLIKQQIQIYSNRVAEIETQLNQQKRDILSVVTPRYVPNNTFLAHLLQRKCRRR